MASHALSEGRAIKPQEQVTKPFEKPDEGEVRCDDDLESVDRYSCKLASLRREFVSVDSLPHDPQVSVRKREVVSENSMAIRTFMILPINES